MRLIALASLVCAGSVLAQEARRAQKPPPPFEQMIEMRAVLRLPGMDRVAARRDIAYKTVGDARLAADIYTPPDAAKDARLPAVILIHGGPIAPGMKPKDWGVFQSLGQLVAARASRWKRSTIWRSFDNSWGRSLRATRRESRRAPRDPGADASALEKGGSEPRYFFAAAVAAGLPRNLRAA